MQRKLLMGLIFVLILALLAACGNNASTAGLNSGSNGNSGEKIKLSIWHNFSGDDLRAKTIRGLIDKFQKDHPEVELDAQAIPPDGYRQRLKTVAAADQIPDVFLMGPGTAAQEFLKADLIQPITPLLDKYPDWKNNFLPGSYDTYTYNNKVYAVPLASSPTSIFFYNKALFDKYKLPVPKTWDDLLAAVKVFKANNITPISLGNKANWVAQSCILGTVADHVTGTDWFLKAVQQNGAKFTDPQFVQTLQYLQDLAKAGAFQDGFNSLDNTQMEQYFVQGKAAMMIDGAWALSNMAATGTKEQLDVIEVGVVPSIPGGKGDPNTLSGVTGASFALSKKVTGKALDAAYQLIYTTSGPDAQKAIADSNSLVNYKVDVDQSKVTPLFFKAYNLMKTVKFTPVYDANLTSAATDAIQNGLQELFLGGNPVNVAQKLQDAQAKTLVK
jgi:raffinose/stachyose/melibiose transport system substrate-binding protein